MSNPSVSRFKGLNNASDPLRLKLGWLSKADNIDITNTGAIERRRGYTRRLNMPTSGAFGTRDHTRLYVVADQQLLSVHADMTTTTVALLAGTGRMHWAEVNRQVFFNNGVDRGFIASDDSVHDWDWPTPPAPALSAVSGALPGGTYQACLTYLLPDGRETGAGPSTSLQLRDGEAVGVSGIPQFPGLTTLLYVAPADSTVFQLVGEVASTSFTWNHQPDALGTDLATQFTDPLPMGTDVIQHWHGRMFAAQYLPPQNQTVVWVSEPLGFHLFNLNSGFFMVPGRVQMLAPTAGALIVGTDAEIYAYDDDAFRQLAPYGTVPGWPWAFDDDNDTVLMWTKRGVCRAVPFQNITQEYVSVPPGLQAGGAFVRHDGEKKFVATLVAGGTAFNPRL
jgi:hypothetical protein